MTTTTLNNGCAGNQQYGTREQAQRAAAPQQKAGRPVRAYPCLICRNWHVGERHGR